MSANRRFIHRAVMVTILGLLWSSINPTASAGPVVPAGGTVSTPLVDVHRLGQLTLEFRAPNPHDDDPGQAHVGIPVHLQRVTGIDLSTSEGWRQAAALSAEEVLALPEERFTDHRSGDSGSDGRVSFTGLPLGLYTVTSPDGAGLVFESFVVTVPMTNATGTGWQYSFIVYPKAGADIGSPTRDPAPDPAPGQEVSEPATEPGASGASSWPGDAGHSSGQPENTGTSGLDDVSRGGLASTGAVVLHIMAAGLSMILLGLFLLRRRMADQ